MSVVGQMASGRAKGRWQETSKGQDRSGSINTKIGKRDRCRMRDEHKGSGQDRRAGVNFEDRELDAIQRVGIVGY